VVNVKARRQQRARLERIDQNLRLNTKLAYSTLLTVPCWLNASRIFNTDSAQKYFSILFKFGKIIAD
jgi:hypothetical protein